MKIQTSNKLAHLQCEYNELMEQTQILSNQIQPMLAQLNQLSQYLSVNAGDRLTLSKYKETQRRYNSLVNQVKRNNQRLNNLSMRIKQEYSRLQLQGQKSAMSMQRQAARQQASMLRQAQKEAMRTGYR